MRSLKVTSFPNGSNYTITEESTSQMMQSSVEIEILACFSQLGRFCHAGIHRHNDFWQDFKTLQNIKNGLKMNGEFSYRQRS
jgi:hypothetical protein